MGAETMRIENVANFFAGRSIFITGGSGFMGKVLVEKLLRSCPDIDKLYLLMRTRKGITINERLDKMFMDEVFNKMKTKNPSFREKIIPVLGDTMKKDLKMSEADKQTIIDNVSIIINNAASVRFDDTLRNAIFSNLRSTRDLCILALSMKKLVAFLHVSSSYAHCDRPVVEEIPYPMDLDWKGVIDVAERVTDDHLLNILTAKYIGTLPNTYVFTKKLAEDVVCYYSDRIPCSICRPSIVVSTMEEPEVGWIGNFNGPVGLMVGSGKGIVRTLYANPSRELDHVPVDFVIKLFLLIIYVRGHTTVKENPTTMIYNMSAYKLKKVSLGYMATYGMVYSVNFNPVPNPLWYPRITLTSSYSYYYVNFLVSQLLVAVIIDAILKFTGRKQILVSIQRRIYTSNIFLSFFMFNSWDFINTNSLSLLKAVSDQDIPDFCFDYDIKDVNGALYSALDGGLKYLLQQGPNSLEKRKRSIKRIWLLTKIFKTTFLILFLWFVLNMMEFV